jgi:ferredoxin-NADP reductase
MMAAVLALTIPVWRLTVDGARGKENLIQVFVKAVTNEALGINSWEFRPVDGGELPPFTVGSHIDLRLSDRLVRSYSLCNSQDDRHRYVVAISKDPRSRGGSKYVHENLKPGDRIKISPPLNNFALVEDTKHTVFFAGGIGITPIWSMIQRLESLGRPWEIHYSTRTHETCAFKEQLDALEKQKPGRVHFNFDQEPGGKISDLKALISETETDAHLYCCGPTAMLKSFEDAARDLGRPAANIHVEYFTSKEEAAVSGGFTVVLQRSKKSFVVAPGKTILDTLLDNNMDMTFSCMQGACRSCETTVLEGVPDHRDAVLSDAERESNKTMMICCSGSKTATLVLDL